MANGVLVKMLLHTKVTKYLEWKCVDASYVIQHQKAGLMSKEKMALCKVPATEMEAIKSSLMSLASLTDLRRAGALWEQIWTVMCMNPS